MDVHKSGIRELVLKHVCFIWGKRVGLNPGPQVFYASTLPLSYILSLRAVFIY
jgi:hypothetical protein